MGRLSQLRALGYHWLLVLGTVMAPMHELRSAAKVGPGELLVAVWCVVGWLSSPRVRLPRIDSGYWLVWLVIVALGSIVGLNRLASGTSPSQLLTWIYLGFVALSVYAIMRSQPLHVMNRVLATIGATSVVVYAFLMAYWTFVGRDFLGLALDFSGVRFTGGGTNPHQVAVLMVVAIFINLRVALEARKMSTRLVFLGLAGLALWPALGTQSDTLVLALVGSALLAGVLMVAHSPLVPKGTNVTLVVIGALILAIAFRNQIVQALWDFILADRNGLGRLELWSEVGGALEQSPLIGLGPGGHSIGNYWEFHSTYVEVLAMSGILGFTLFLAYNLYLLSKVARYPTLLLIASPLFLYGISGFAARRLPYWVVLMLVVAIADSAYESIGRRRNTESKSPGAVEQRSWQEDEVGTITK